MATMKQISTLIELKQDLGEEFNRITFTKEMLKASHKEVQEEFRRINALRPATDRQMTWIAQLELEVYGDIYTLGQVLSYQDASDLIPKLELLTKQKKNHDRVAELVGGERLTEIELLESRLRMLKADAAMEEVAA